MEWLWNLVGAFVPDLGGWIVYLVGAVVLVVVGWFGGGSRAKRKASDAALDATIKGNEAARQGRLQARDALQAGKTPQEIKEANDAQWR